MDLTEFDAAHPLLAPANDDCHAQWLKDYGSDRVAVEPSREVSNAV